MGVRERIRSVDAIRKLMPESVDGADGEAKKKQKIAAVPAAKAKGASQGKTVSFGHSCALCGTVCGKDCVGVSKSQTPEVLNRFSQGVSG